MATAKKNAKTAAAKKPAPSKKSGAKKPVWQAGELQSPTGAQLRLYTIRPAGKAKAVVQINHGLVEHAARYERFARLLAGRGYAVIAHDHRGHGYTTAPDAPLGVFAAHDGRQKVIADVDAVNAHARETFKGAPIVCFGHSMGAMIALSWCATHPSAADAMAVWNTSVEAPLLLKVLNGVLKVERMLKGSDVPSSIAPKLVFDAWNREFAPNRTGFDWLSRDNAEVDKYVADPLCGFPASIGLWLSLIEIVRFDADNRNLAALPKDLPVNLNAGTKDPASGHGRDIARLAERLRGIGMTDVTHGMRQDGRHEGLNEIDRDETMAEFAKWLDARFG